MFARSDRIRELPIHAGNADAAVAEHRVEHPKREKNKVRQQDCAQVNHSLRTKDFNKQNGNILPHRR